jgi:nucleoside 2-deoxyribosyltransferase
MTKKLYLISSLRIDTVRDCANELREVGFDVFDDWHAAGPQADDIWRDYEKQRGRTYLEALAGYHAKHVFALDHKHLSEADVAVLLLPAGRSGHLELGWHLGRGKPGYILIDDPDRWDVMYQFATGVFADKAKMFEALRTHL